MLIEAGILLSVTSGGLLAREVWNRKQTPDKEMHKIVKEIFENRRFGILKGKGKNAYVQYPSLVNSDMKKMYVTLVYKLPKGINLQLLDGLKDSIQEAIGTDHMVMSLAGKSVIKMKIATHPMPNRIPLAPFIGKFGKWSIPVGIHQFGMVSHNFEHHPILVGGGATRFGKTVFMKNMLTSLVLQAPDDVEFYIIDLKEGVEFTEYKDLKQVKAVVDDINDAEKLLVRLDKERTKVAEWFKAKKIKNISNTGIQKRRFIIVDESHELAKASHMKPEQKKQMDKCQYLLSRLASKGGAFGYRMVVFTQYPVKEAIPQKIKQNSTARITLKVADNVASRVILDEDGAEDLPDDVKGRAIYKSHKKETIQIPIHMDEEGKELEHIDLLKEYIVEKGDTANDDKGEVSVTGGTDIIDD